MLHEYFPWLRPNVIALCTCLVRSGLTVLQVESENLFLLLVTIINNRNLIVLGCEISFRNVVCVQTYQRGSIEKY